VISELIGKTITKIEGLKVNSGVVRFETACGEVYYMYHEHDDWEDVRIVEISGDASNLIGMPVTDAAETQPKLDRRPGSQSSWTWTFYKIVTPLGWVDIRWYGTSNGYYSEDVEFENERDIPKWLHIDLNASTNTASRA